MHDRDYQIIANPNARRGTTRNTLEQILSYLQENQIHTEVHCTEYPRHGIELVQKLIETGYTHLISAGGDGTAFEVINGILKSGKSSEITLGLLPLGTGNAFLLDFDLQSPHQAAQKIVNNKPRSIDIGCINSDDGDYYFHNMVGFGFIAQACRAQRDRFRRMGRLSYHAAFLYCLFHLRNQTVDLKIDQENSISTKTLMFAFCNSKYTGNDMMISPESSTQDGFLNYLLAPKLSAWQILSLFGGLSKGKHLQDKRIHHRLIKKAKVDLPTKQDVMVDGEVLHFQNAEISVIPAALKVLL